MSARLRVPLPETALYAPPPTSIDPDTAKSWLRRAMPIVLAHKRTFLVALFFSFVALLFQVQIPNLLNEAIDNSIASRAVPLEHYVWWVLALGLGGGVAGYVSRLAIYRTAYEIEFDLRNIIYEHLTRLSASFYDRVQSGQLISRANSDIRSVQMYMTFAPFILLQCSIAVIAFGYMLAIDVPLALIAMATMPGVFYVGMRMRKSLFPISWLIQARLADVATIVDENVNGVRVVKSFAAEEHELRSLARAATRLQWGYVKDADLRARFTPAVQNLPQLGLVMVLFFGGWMVIDGHLKVGAILAFNAYLLMLQVPFTMLGMLVMMGQRAAASADRIYEVLDERPEVVDRQGAIDLVAAGGAVSFRDVTFSYPAGDRPEVLRRLSLDIHPGETVALVGRIGSGKSTVARLLARWYDVDEGAVLVDGHDVRDLTLASLRANIGIVLDEPFLFSASIGENIAYGRPSASSQEIEAAAEAAQATGFIAELPEGYDTIVGERGYTLSGGQRQRIAIARTLLLNPPILVLDDATSAIDVHVEEKIHNALRSLLRQRTTIVIAHRLSTIRLADRVLVLDDGHVAAEGTHASLLESSNLYSEVLAQVSVDEDIPEGGER